MHDKVAWPGRRIVDPAKPNLRSILGITPDLVRMCRMRTQANTDIRHLLGENPQPALTIGLVSDCRVKLPNALPCYGTASFKKTICVDSRRRRVLV
jgi:hypothetical protein